MMLSPEELKGIEERCHLPNNTACQLCGSTRLPLHIDSKCPECSKYTPLSDDDMDELLIAANALAPEIGLHTVIDLQKLIPRAVNTIQELRNKE